MPPPPPWFLWALLGALFAGVTAVLAKLALADVDADMAILIRTALLILLLPLLVLAGGHWSDPLAIPARSWLFLALSALATALSWICSFRALKLGPASLVAPVDKLSVLVVALLAVIVLGERPSALGWLALALVSSGGVLFSLAG
jgi:transporter family protein